MKLVTPKLVAIGLLCLFISCSTDEISEIDNGTNLENTITIENDDAFSGEVLELVNAHRAALNLPPFLPHQKAKNQAINHTAYMIQKNRISHDNFIERSDFLKTHGAQVVSENVAYGYRTAATVLEGWLNSPSHKEAIEGNYTHSGIGIARNGNGINYFTQIFVK